MAMMMTGRVLLVCALCVLWCGAVFGHAMDDYCSEGGGNGLRHTSNGDDGVSLKAECGLLSARMALIKAVEAAEGKQELSGPDPPQDKSRVSSPDNKLGNNTQSTGAPGAGGGGVGGQPAAVTPKPGGSDTEEQVGELGVMDTNNGKVAGDEEQKDGNEADSQQQSVDQLTSSSSSSGSSGTEGVKQPSSRANSKSKETLDELPQEEEEEDLPSESDSREEEAEEQETEEDKKNDKMVHKSPTETPGGPTNNAEIQTATTQVNGDSIPETLEDVQQPEEFQGEKDSNNNSQTKSAASIAANQHNEPSADHGESGPPSPTANGDAANNDSDKSTEDGIPNSDPVSDAPGTAEEKQNENKESNPKETPVTATAMKNTTATTGDSDGSTAISHTTSPLLLLLVAACAAAAAVVAA
ncbi:Mucin-associated surface protein (MASP) [Trypanosoma cruzi]|uniref:Mucin-associated surface protein (MASP), putative n=2 Tax=Trypanosoma cruzi TaxID=5693 RepID=Q4DA17_TRYCC|nr:mucin-associated surface protein (MASP), putative [Trypanosoma cruzi]EAN89368.1 mucin-associated surface protein (MASP), putative [Trypanosoma cruzi]PWV10664.1 Mucin-associated surface protein (MASP) [Trypanosoma cruzi]|eukprot:XP_811219.1 mucin-associated surface protein (MASP) [Trypanosoma cruzi strain CL Brener]